VLSLAHSGAPFHEIYRINTVLPLVICLAMIGSCFNELRPVCHLKLRIVSRTVLDPLALLPLIDRKQENEGSRLYKNYSHGALSAVQVESA
jgi:hypothetical protein